MYPIELLRNRTVRTLAVGALAFVAVGVTAGFAAAASGTQILPFQTAALVASTTKPSAPGAGARWCTDLLGHAATNLKIPASRLQAQLELAAKQTVQDAVSQGKLTQAQADKIEKRLAGRSLCAGVVNGLGRHPAGARRLRKEVIAAAAGVLKVTPPQLIADLRGGDSLSKLASQHGIPDEATFRTDLVTAITPTLDSAVGAGKLTRAQETAILNRIKSAPVPFWTRGIVRHDPARPPAGIAGS
ncbi:MAG: hypothetical protein ACREPA_02890 [Candidatus Dormibacteraceae bacterium]